MDEDVGRILKSLQLSADFDPVSLAGQVEAQYHEIQMRLFRKPKRLLTGFVHADDSHTDRSS